MKISVLICVHSVTTDNDLLLRRALESLVRQTFDDFETVVVMDECHPDTINIVEPYQEVLDLKIYRRPKKEGLAKAKNYGIEKCSGDWIAFLDADDQYMDCKLEIQTRYLSKNPYVGICGTLAWDNQDGILYPSCFQPGQYEKHIDIIRRLRVENVMCHGSIMLDKAIWKNLEGYPTGKESLGMEDWALWQRAANEGHIFYNIPERLYIYSMGTGVVRGEVGDDEEEEEN